MDMEQDKELDALDSAVERRIRQITEAVSRPGSLDSLTSVVRYLGESNKDVVHVLVRSKKDIRGIPELVELLRLYFGCSRKTLEFLNTLQEWLHGGSGVSWRLDRLKSALCEFKTDNTKTGYGRVLLQRALNGFMRANDPLVAERLRAKLKVALDEQGRLYERLRDKKHALYIQNMRLTQVYRRVTTAILTSVYILLTVCVAVTTVLTVPPAVVAIAAIANISLNLINPTRTLMDHIWDKYEEKLRRRSELVNTIMESRTGITLNDLENIRGVVHALQAKIQGFSNAATAATLRKDCVLKAMIDDMEKKIDDFARAIKDLQAKKDKCHKDVMDARTVILGTVY